MLNYVLMGIGTVLALLFIVFLFRGARYDDMLAVLEGDEFPLKAIYSVGLGLQDVKAAALGGERGDKLRSDAALLYSRQYGEYYARIIWAQVLSFALLFLALGFLFGGMTTGTLSLFCVAAGIFLAAFSAWYFYTHSATQIKERKEQAEDEFPNAISKLALIVNSGVILHDAWKIVAEGKDGVFYDLMKESVEAMENGTSDAEAIHQFGVRTNSEDIKKFTSALIQSIERGGGELPRFLANQSKELWAHRRQVMLQRGEQAASALLMPIAIMFGGVILIVIAAAMQSFSL